MQFKLSNAVAVQAPDVERAFDFYGGVLGFPIKEDDGMRLIEAARTLLEANGCKMLLWEGAGKACVVEDPFGVRFNLWQNG